MRSGIVIVPVGRVEIRVLAHVCAAVTETFGRRCRIGDALPAPEYAFDPRRRQYAAEAILERLHPGTAERVLGVVDLDLCVP